jgi:hypothetical protein
MLSKNTVVKQSRSVAVYPVGRATAETLIPGKGHSGKSDPLGEGLPSGKSNL